MDNISSSLLLQVLGSTTSRGAVQATHHCIVLHAGAECIWRITDVAVCMKLTQPLN